MLAVIIPVQRELYFLNAFILLYWLYLPNEIMHLVIFCLRTTALWDRRRSVLIILLATLLVSDPHNLSIGGGSLIYLYGYTRYATRQ